MLLWNVTRRAASAERDHAAHVQCDALVHATRTSTEHVKETTEALRGLAVQQAQAPQGAGAGAAARPGAAHHHDAQLGEALNNI